VSALSDVVYASRGMTARRVAHLLPTEQVDKRWRVALCGMNIGLYGGPLTYLPDGVRVCLDCENPDRVRIRRKAHAATKKAIDSGILVRSSCAECGCRPFKVERYGREYVVAHHDDYSKPLEVRWLCSQCHARWHLENVAKYPILEVAS
jgi:ribosomal protein S27AE